ncbi:PEP-CTERM sorting domain-containing protein [Rubritalea spongiae]|uniref:PEP-CTERM sorting domain-containing protein n=1 Tax=Rubritalea spongiae TaxID=430797 RepID=UPI00360B632B
MSTRPSIDFGIPNIQLVRSGPANGSVSYTWDSSARSITHDLGTNVGSAVADTLDDTNTFDILGANYTAILTVDEDGDNNTSGPRFDTTSDLSFTATISTAAVPEPSSTVLLSLSALALIARRRK